MTGDNETPDDEQDIWHEVARSITPLKGRKAVVLPEVTVKKPVIRSSAPAALPPVKNTPPSPLPAKRLKQLRQQKIPVERTLDLHGMTMAVAHDAVQRFILSAYRQQLRCVEVITGIGRMEGTGQLKRFFPMWIQEAPLSGYILHAAVNPKSRGGSYLVLLRRNISRD